jgi:hypothetical protein
MTTFNKLLAIKEGGGNPGAPGSSDTLNVALADFNLTASGNSLLALDAVSLDFGNATANPAFTFLGTGDFTVAGDSWFKATGGNTGDPDFLVDGYAKFSGAIEVTGSSLFTGDATFNSNVTVLGTLVTKQTESILISDNYIDMNSDYATVSPQDTGFTFNYSPIANATITAMASPANTITLAANSGITLNPGDIVLVTGLDAADVQNEGLYEVLTFASDVITVNTASGLTFLKHAVSVTVAVAPQGATLAHVNLGVLRVSTAGDLQYGENSDANITFGDVPYNGYVGSQDWTGNLELMSTVGNPAYLRVNDNDGDYTFIAAQDGISAALSILIENGAQDSNGLLFQAAAGNVDVNNTNGALYTKTESGIIELFYNSEINGVETPIQITANGELNVTIPTVTLQAAYDGGTSITTTANGGAVTINDGTQGGSPALDVTGSMSLTGDINIYDPQTVSVFTVAAASGNTDLLGTLDVGAAATFDSTVTAKGDLSVVDANNASMFSVAAATGDTEIAGDVTLSATGGNANDPDLSVAGYAQFAGTLDLDGSVDADVSSFDVVSTGNLNLASEGDISLEADGLLNLSGSSITANLSVLAAAAIGGNKLVAMGANGLVEALADAKDVIALGVAVSAISQGAASDGLVAEIGTVSVKAEVNLVTAIVAGERLYLSSVDEGRVTNVPPSASNTTVFQVGVALAGAAAGDAAVLAFRPQFLYNNY